MTGAARRSLTARFRLRDGQPALVLRRIAASGYSDGDLKMLQWTTAESGRRLGGISRHDDVDRDCAYDHFSHVGYLDWAVDRASGWGWIVISRREDRLEMFAP